MCNFNLPVFVILVVISSVMAAPKPISFDEFGRKIYDFGQKALPAVRGVCNIVNPYQGYPQNSGYLPNSGYPHVQGYHPQFPNYYPQYPQNIGPVSPRFPASPNFPSTKDGAPSVGASEQDDLNNNLFSTNNLQNTPPEIQDVLKNFNKLPRLDTPTVNAAENNKILEWPAENNMK
ncbi:hypothetical protein NQ314_016727 [Rhamnusium bicolor]|uniref:Uncharacterized protein n=1 Tax=Rhamnusium bicolor TaxID=1586634 RepID=A0AAV8WVR0_9CUCU|nr:hypothetical protein NQ314_016727 [Rhamnusium bicolor]